MATIHIKELSITADASLIHLLASFTSAFLSSASVTPAVATAVETALEVKEPEVKEPEVKEPEVKEPEVTVPVFTAPVFKAPVANTVQYYNPMDDRELVTLVNEGLTTKSDAFKEGKNAIVFFRNALGIHYGITNAEIVTSRIKNSKTTMAAVDELFLFVEANHLRKWFSPGIAIGVFNVLTKLTEADKKAAVFSLKAALRHASYDVAEVPKEVEDITQVLRSAANITIEPNMLRYSVVANHVESKLANVFDKFIKHKTTARKLTGY